MSLSHRFAREDTEKAQTDAFETFWALYPRKVAKLEALKAWKQMTRDYAPAEIIAGIERNAPSMARKDKQYIKHPASWLRAGCWMDEPEISRPTNYTDAVRSIFGGPESISVGGHDVQRVPDRIGRH